MIWLCLSICKLPGMRCRCNDLFFLIMQNGDRQNGDRLPVVRAARYPSSQPILVFDTDVGNGEDDRLLTGGESGFGEPPSGISLSAPGDGDKCGTDAAQAGHICTLCVPVYTEQNFSGSRCFTSERSPSPIMLNRSASNT